MKLSKMVLLVAFCMFVSLMIPSTVSSQEFEDVLEQNRTYEYLLNWTIYVDQFDSYNESARAVIMQNGTMIDPVAIINTEPLNNRTNYSYSCYGVNSSSLLMAKVTTSNGSFFVSSKIVEVLFANSSSNDCSILHYHLPHHIHCLKKLMCCLIAIVLDI